MININKIIEKISDVQSWIMSLNEENRYKEKIGIEIKIVENLKQKYLKLQLIFLDSPTILPYPSFPISSKIVYIWNEKKKEPVDITLFSEYIKSLTSISSIESGVRIYVYPEKLRDNKDFIDDLQKVFIDIIK